MYVSPVKPAVLQNHRFLDTVFVAAFLLGCTAARILCHRTVPYSTTIVSCRFVRLRRYEAYQLHCSSVRSFHSSFRFLRVAASRKACALHLAIDMFKHYGDLKNLRMCNNIRG